MGRKKKVTKGKQKIEMKRLESEDARYVCFSKRKAGIHSKASELATLCGAEVAIVLDSPTGCPYTFGSPGVNQVAERFLSGGITMRGLGAHEARRLSIVQDLNRRCMEISNLLDATKKRKVALEERLNSLIQANQQVEKFEKMDELSLIELLEMKKSIYELKKRIGSHYFQQLTGGTSSSTYGNTITCLF